MLKKYSGVLLTVWWVLIFMATHIPVPEQAPGLPYVDKIIHVSMYCGLAFLLAVWWHKRTTLKMSHLASIILIVLMYAFLDEFLQGFTGRDPDIKDGIADMIGALSGLLLFANLWL